MVFSSSTSTASHVADPLVSHWLSCPTQRKAFTPEQPACMALNPISNRFAWLWQNDALSDTTLQIQALPKLPKGGASAEDLAVSSSTLEKEEFRLHSVVLATSSGYFRHRLLAACTPANDEPSELLSANSGHPTSSPGGHESPAPPSKVAHHIQERLHPADLAAAKYVLRHMYTDELVYDSPSHLVTLLKIADKWKCWDTIDACRRAFTSFAPEDLDLDVIKQVFSLEGIIHDLHNFSELVTAVQSRLVSMFEDIVEVVQNMHTRTGFLQLPFAAVLALLRSPHLIVDCENTVLVAANLWLVQGKGKAATQEQRRCLAGAIQLAGLTPSYLCGVLPNLTWFTPPNQPFVSWPQALPAPYYNELQERLVSPKAKQVVHAGSDAKDATQTATSASGATTANGTSATASQGVSFSTASSVPAPGTPKNTATSAGKRGGFSADGAETANGKLPARASRTSNGGEKAPGTPSAAADATPHVMTRGAGPASTLVAAAPAPPRIIREQNLEIECDIEFNRLKQYLEEGLEGLQSGRQGFRGIHVHSECSYFKGFMWGIKLVFGYSAGHGPDEQQPAFRVTPSPFASLPPGDEGMRPLVCPVTVSFKCTMEGLGAQGTPFASATYQGASYMKPGEEHVSSIGIANFFKRVGAQQQPENWLPYLVNDKLRLRLRVTGGSVE